MHWLRLQEMVQTNSDIFLSIVGFNNVLQTKPVDAPLFLAHRPVITNTSMVQVDGGYHYDSVAGVIWCTDQVCEPSK